MVTEIRQNQSAADAASWEKLISLSLPPNQRRGPSKSKNEVDEDGNAVEEDVEEEVYVYSCLSVLLDLSDLS